ncbi:MAG TPA: tetratricopeptide repeat protein [Thermoanaerobaculia bacterium]|nr:tetratricopeptide repeat protein [Thermoanaerobaculia bacterium]
MSHYDQEALFEYVEGISPIASDIQSHVTSCEECSAEVGEQRAMMASLGDADVWEPAPPSSPRQFVVNVTAFAERARQEEDAAAALCDEVLTGPHAWWPQRLRKAAGSQTAGLVKHLLERWRQLVDSHPAAGLQVTTLASEVANALDVAQYPCDYVVKLRAQAYRDHAFVLSFMGRHPEALNVVDRAKRLFEQVPLPEYDLARVSFVKAGILRHIDRTEEAVALARQAADTFLRFGDRSRYLNTRIVEAAILYDAGSIRDALILWESIKGDPGLEDVSAVRITHNLAVGYAQLHQPERAAEYGREAVAQFELLGMDTACARSRWLLGNALVECGKTRDALPILRTAWREFEQFGMISEAGIAALELAEALLMVGETEEVPAICRDVITQFTRAGMASRAMTALSFLREAVAIGQATPSLVRHVHTFLRGLPEEQPRLFAPPTPGAGE